MYPSRRLSTQFLPERRYVKTPIHHSDRIHQFQHHQEGMYSMYQPKRQLNHMIAMVEHPNRVTLKPPMIEPVIEPPNPNPNKRTEPPETPQFKPMPGLEQGPSFDKPYPRPSNPNHPPRILPDKRRKTV